MGAHSSAHDLMAGVESDAIRVKAVAMAVQMSGWLVAPAGEITPMDPGCIDGPGAHWISSDLVEWCRSARDVLEAVGRG